MLKRVVIKISGYVQGVGFRYSAREKAQQLGLTGYVRNIPDGGIEIVAEGEEDDLQKLVDWTNHGPIFAKVNDQTIAWQDASRVYQNFQIIY